ncbi:YcsE [Treponema primitia ZAS-2]|uniref:YcsE n=1 Tax=Treponema primitia (strain ATCC BAA-887 / DSM 12427 / ZAS-2) TaxID=545694 RepID=F5YNM6_TREPZ|nr:HAD family hydrolase [Treponema primitia]AEF85828.1 YcsE [Treponema primitia ZAS-2]
MKGKIVFLDFDGTVGDRNFIPFSASRACRRARANGHILYLATGRSLVQVNPGLVKKMFDGAVYSSGAYIEAAPELRGELRCKWRGGKRELIYTAVMDSALVDRLIGFLDKHGAFYMLELADRVIAGPGFDAYFKALFTGRKWTPALLLEKFFVGMIYRRSLSLNEPMLHRADVLKLVFMIRGGISFEDIQKEFGGECEIVRSSIPITGMSGGEISPKGVHKGAALLKVIARHGIARENSIAIGDSDNDRTMIEAAGIGIAMGNGDEKLKAIADDVTDTLYRNGLAKAFKKYGLV